MVGDGGVCGPLTSFGSHGNQERERKNQSFVALVETV